MVIEAQGLEKTYETPAGSFPALRGVDLAVEAGELLAVVGRSGSGKSTLLHLLGGIDRASAGRLAVSGQALADLSENQLARWRGRHVGLVFQAFQLLPTLSALENVLLPMDFLGESAPKERRTRALELLARVGVADQAAKLPSMLSGGQQQRVAIARALANQPTLILADEPTGNLDSTTAQEVFELFRELSRTGTTVVIATHERDIASASHRVLTLVDGRVVT